VTIHFVDEGIDSGPIILQRTVEVPYTRDRSELESAIHEVEHELLPEAIRMIASGAVRADPENPRLVRIEKAEKTADG
jgi:phosphoribosylglycinamide formyltransferase-1